MGREEEATFIEYTLGPGVSEVNEPDSLASWMGAVPLVGIMETSELGRSGAVLPRVPLDPGRPIEEGISVQSYVHLFDSC